MFRESISSTLADKVWSIGRVARLSEVNEIGLRAYLKGGTTIGLKSVEAIFRTLGINVTDNDGKFYWHGYDIRTAIKRGMTEQKMLVKDMCDRCDLKQPNLTEFLAGRSVSRPAKVEAMLSALGLSVAVIETPKRMPRLKTGRRKKTKFQIGEAIRQALEARGISKYKFAKDYGFSDGNLSVFLNDGRYVSPDRMERIFSLLGMTITDDEADYGTDIRAAIQAARGKRKLTYSNLGEVCGCTGEMVMFYLTGRNETSAQRVDAMFAALGLRLKW